MRSFSFRDVGYIRGLWDCEEFKTSAVWSEKLVLNLKIPHQSSTQKEARQSSTARSHSGFDQFWWGLCCGRPVSCSAGTPRRLTFGESAVAALDRDDVSVEDLQWAWDRLDSVVHPSDLHLRSENSKTTELCECGRHWFRKNVEEDWRFWRWFYSRVFWHAQLNYACQRAERLVTGAGTVDNLAGDQLCIWKQVNLDESTIIPSTHLTICVPPSLGAYILDQKEHPQWAHHEIGSGYRPNKWSKEMSNTGLSNQISDFWRSWCRLIVPFMAKFKFNSK